MAKNPDSDGKSNNPLSFHFGGCGVFSPSFRFKTHPKSDCDSSSLEEFSVQCFHGNHALLVVQRQDTNKPLES